MNVSSIKTPGVYINEIDAFPQSVAQVATAIPAFVGYTEKGPTDPTRIVSLLEYKQLFGGGPQPTTITIALDANNQPTSATNAVESKFNLYNSLQLFYANGGGECYIVSVGNYAPNLIEESQLILGLESLRDYDEPTLLLFPDAVSLTAAGLGNVQKSALLQCQDLMDRFVIMDVKQETSLVADNLAFRDNVGINSLKYGAAYYPYLVSNFNEYSFNYDAINAKLPTNKKFVDLYPEKADVASFNTLLTLVAANKTSWSATSKSPMIAITSKAEMTSALNAGLDVLKIFGKPDSIAGHAKFLTFVKTDLVTNRLKAFGKSLIDFGAAYNDIVTPAGSKVTFSDLNLATNFDSNWGFPASAFPTSMTGNEFSGKLSLPLTPTVLDNALVLEQFNLLLARIVTGMNSAFVLVDKFQSIEETNLLPQLPLFATIASKLNQSMNTTPPSGAVAGSYAQTDATRGVWKAPANLSLNGIVGLTDDINDLEQEPMNIHESGKSINAIRKFTGKGFLVWGARTLDGNSNDWRYVNVRRLANMIEESVKKACMHYVFEPNVAQTWVNVKGMIENYLSTVWSDGGLAGAKPEHAFFVAVGINQTMTAQDILEGRMIVKIGYAPSRPAEFIILEFKQMLQQS